MVECTGLENRNTRKRIEGSNPSLSAKQKNGPERGRFFWRRVECKWVRRFNRRRAGHVAQDTVHQRGMMGSP